MDFTVEITKKNLALMKDEVYVKIYQNSVIVWLKMDMYFRFTCTCRLAYNCREHGSAESTQ